MERGVIRVWNRPSTTLLMALRKHKPPGDASLVNTASLNLPNKVVKKVNPVKSGMATDLNAESDVDIDLREVYFLIMHFLSAGPCKRTYGQLWNELLEHQLLPRRYHAWYSRSGARSGDENDDGMSLPLCYANLVERYPHIAKDHLVKLLKQLILNDRCKEDKGAKKVPVYLRWPHMQADQVRGLSLREIGGGFTRHHRAPSIPAACNAIARPSTLVQKMQIIKKSRGHQNAVYCATFDRSGRYVITGSDDRLVKIWSMETAFCLASCRGHEGDITDLAVSFNNSLVASSSNDFIIRVWRIPDGLPISVLKGHAAAVTAIAFSPRPNAVYHLLSSSDDGTCRIWDARYSKPSLQVYSPKPLDTSAGKNNDPSPSAVQQNHQILCCAFNANGTVFVTGSSDTYARVWNAFKINPDESDQRHHEMDLLSGHENDVNYVQFSGCAVAPRSSTADTLKEDNLPKFKNSWFTHDNIVTCSRDGSAIIWIPRSRRSHGKVGHWTRAYHLKVPPPPMAPQPTRGGPRHRCQPTPRGVNMIVWSLDNRFVLAAIMDCRICVWNASDGSLVHSLIGHKESTFVLDVHPFNPRIAMSAGYDGKTIIWDIWEGKPVQIYETGQFKLVDGKFSPDGTSIVLSDEVGQIYIIATGQGESQKDAKYDQFFLGDYRPLIQDTNGNVLDQETQLAPYRRNVQDLLCDASIIPYPEPYQSIYQRRRLGALGIEWRPPSVNFAVGPTFNPNTGDFQPLPIIDLERWAEPLPEVADAVNWELENEAVQTDDNDSEYNVTDEYSSEGEPESLNSSSSGDSVSSAEDSGVSLNKEGLRRSKRKKHKPEAEFTSSGRRVKRRNLDERDAVTTSRTNRVRRSRNGHLASKKKSSKSKSLRPQRRAACNALNLFSKMTGISTDGEEEDEMDSTSSESESMTLPDSNSQSVESEKSMRNSQPKQSKDKEVLRECEDVEKPSQPVEAPENTGVKRKLVLRLPNRCSKAVVPSDSMKAEVPKQETADHDEANTIKWGEVKLRSSKRLKFVDSSAGDAECPGTFEGDTNGHPNSNDECGASSSPKYQAHGVNVVGRNGRHVDFASQELNDGLIKEALPEWDGSNRQLLGHVDQEDRLSLQANGKTTESVIHKDEDFHDRGIVNGKNSGRTDSKNGSAQGQQVETCSSQPVYRKIRIKSRGLMKEDNSSSSKLKSPDLGHLRTSGSEQMIKSQMAAEKSRVSVLDEEEESIGINSNTDPHGSNKLQVNSYSKMYNTVYKRSKSSRSRKSFDVDIHEMEESTSLSNYSEDRQAETSVAAVDSVHGSRFRATRANFGSLEASTSGGRYFSDARDQLLPDEWKSASKTIVGMRSVRNRRENYSFSDPRPLDKRKHQPSRKLSWLMLLEHEESYRYIPQQGDDVAYLRQGHEEYIRGSRQSQEAGPWKSIRDLKAVEFCRVRALEYAPFKGSGEGCCKLTLEFTDPSSSAFGKAFKVTLPELVSFPDFLVERTRYDAAIERNWTHRDKCQVWWRNEDGDGGSWWDGRILAVKTRASEFPDSPWERYVIQYKDDGSEQHFHSPWELHDADSQWEHPHIDLGIRDKLLSCISKLEHTSARNQDCYGVQKLNQVAQKSDFLNRFPVQFSIEVIKRRLENNYYRTLEAVKLDASVMLSNAESYFGKSADMSNRMRRLSDWITRTFSSL
uniref:Bromodomain and WD repeat-containing protein 3 n=1 Tax=Ananas comosus var. bracteatus TaxID=296719 RepID=A0A6V7PQT3_ANACO|nr:unnamed protein product [Ananas comosus var. bracteatus]